MDLLNDLIHNFHIEINAVAHISHPFVINRFYDEQGLMERWRAPTFVDLTKVQKEDTEQWIKKLRTAVLNEVPVCMLCNHSYEEFLQSKLFPLSRAGILLYQKWWIGEKFTFILLFNFSLENIEFLKKYGFIINSAFSFPNPLTFVKKGCIL